ncbi:hypothetical protein G6F24_018642 [Rhizopus arrhizus]|nr:hypothetical protein G6F24_018642 [Rhizopus arrhizus]
MISVELLRGQFGVFQADRGVQPAEVFQHAFEHLHAVGGVQDQHVLAVGRPQRETRAAGFLGMRRGQEQQRGGDCAQAAADPARG